MNAEFESLFGRHIDYNDEIIEQIYNILYI